MCNEYNSSLELTNKISVQGWREDLVFSNLYLLKWSEINLPYCSFLSLSSATWPTMLLNVLQLHTETHITPTHLPNTCHPNPKRAVVKAPASLLCASQSISYLSSPSSLLSPSFPLPADSSALTHQQKIFTTQIRSRDESFFLNIVMKKHCRVIKHRESRRQRMEIMNMRRVSYFSFFLCFTCIKLINYIIVQKWYMILLDNILM